MINMINYNANELMQGEQSDVGHGEYYQLYNNYLLSHIYQKLAINSLFDIVSSSPYKMTLKVRIQMQAFYILILQLLNIQLTISIMNLRHRMFKIKTKPNDQHQHSEEKINKSNSVEVLEKDNHVQGQFSELVEMFKDFIHHTNTKETSISNNKYDVQARDRQVIVEIPKMKEGEISDSELKHWATNTMKTVCSAAFHYFSKNQMSFQQAKIFCSQNILKNMVALSEICCFSAREFQMVDKHVKAGVLDYLSAKYPLTDSTQINKKLQQTVHEVDNIQSLKNDYFSTTDLVFEYRQDGNYNDLIMKMMNDVMNLIDGQSKGKRNNFDGFRQFMSNLFEKVEDQDWVRSQESEQMEESVISEEPKQNIKGTVCKTSIYGGNQNYLERLRRHNDQRDKYRSKVKEYTNYLIGRKIPEDAPRYSDKQIKNMNITIKTPTVLRILTKWCDELWQKFQNGSYFSDRSESVKVQRGGHVNSLLAWMRKYLDQQLLQQKQDILKYMTELSENNYLMQANILEREMQQNSFGSDQYVDVMEKISGKFSLKVVKNLHSYIIAFLNRLIHGLLKISKRMYDENQLSQYSNWPTPVNLLTFKVGDLMRCKCSSHEKQILMIYKELQRLSHEEPEKLRIVRIKNRLRSGTNDILINVKFKQLVTCEIQLAVKTSASDFIKCSNLFHHYFYELQRSHFGPLTELCSIWSSLDRKSEIYQKLLDEDELHTERKDHICKKLNKRFEMVRYDQPFICGQCSRTYFHNNYLYSHSRCSVCSFFICAKCKMDADNDEVLINSLITYPTLRSQCIRRIHETDTLPSFGVCVYIQMKKSKPEVFTHIKSQKSSKQYLLGSNKGSIYQIDSIDNQKKIKAFRSKYILFELDPCEQFPIISQQQATKGYILPLMVKTYYKKEKESISLMDHRLTSKQCSQILGVGTKTQKQTVKNLFLVDNRLDKLPFDPNEFPNLRWLTLSRNPLSSYENLDKCSNLVNFIAANINLKEIPLQLFSLQNIQSLCLSSNNIEHISDEISKLTKLKELQFDNNGLKQLPQSLFECLNLTKLKIQGNQLKQIPESIGKLSKLQSFCCNKNQLQTLPEHIGQLSNLKELNVSLNPGLKSLPTNLYNLHNLQVIDGSYTALNEIPQNLNHLPKLRAIKFSSCLNITSIPSSISTLKDLEQIDLSGCSKLQLHENLGELIRLKNINLSNCGLNDLPQSFKKLRHLQILNLSNNPLNDISKDFFAQLVQLTQLSMESSNLKAFPDLRSCNKLTKLNLSGNSISQIGRDYIGNLTNIQQFIINQNCLQYFPGSILDFSKLQVLSASSNKIKNIINQKDIQNIQLSISLNPIWPFLRSVQLQNNLLTQVPFPLLQCTKLTELRLSVNQITFISKDIANLAKLKQFEMNWNQIKEIPVQISQMRSLQRLYLSNNQITKIPNQIQHTPRLRMFYVENNPIKAFQEIKWVITKSISCGSLYSTVYDLMHQQTEEAFHSAAESKENF